MRRDALFLAALGAGAYWASRQPGGIPGTWKRLQQGVRDIAAGQDPRAVGKRFIAGRDEEPAGMLLEAVPATPDLAPQEPYSYQVSTATP